VQNGIQGGDPLDWNNVGDMLNAILLPHISKFPGLDAFANINNPDSILFPFLLRLQQYPWVRIIH
jgi:hypothetical protein